MYLIKDREKNLTLTLDKIIKYNFYYVTNKHLENVYLVLKEFSKKKSDAAFLISPLMKEYNSFFL